VQRLLGIVILLVVIFGVFLRFVRLGNSRRVQVGKLWYVCIPISIVI
jgi:hypothetical protein